MEWKYEIKWEVTARTKVCGLLIAQLHNMHNPSTSH